MKMKTTFKWKCAVGITLLSITTSALSAVGLSQTRLILSEENKTETIVARNNALSPFLVSSYITKTVDEIKPLKNDFVITPQLFRLEGNSQSAIKIQIVDSNLPVDRESIFYFHSRNIPNTSQHSEGITVGLENVIKVFYRPSGLTMTSKTAFASLQVEPISSGVKLVNSSPYHINLHSLTVNGQSVPISLKSRNNLIAPFSAQTYTTQHQHGEVTWRVFNDLGGVNAYTKSL